MKIQAHIIAQLWELAEGNCSKKEAELLRQHIATDEAIASAWREITEAQALLRNWEAAQPSMRFQQDVLERLPSRSKTPELVPRWVPQLIFGGFILAFVPSLYVSFQVAGDKASPDHILLQLPLGEVIGQLFSMQALPDSSLLCYLAGCALMLSVLLGFDRYYLNKRIET